MAVVAIKAYRTKSGKFVPSFRRRIGTGFKRKKTGLQPRFLKRKK